MTFYEFTYRTSFAAWHNTDPEGKSTFWTPGIVSARVGPTLRSSTGFWLSSAWCSNLASRGHQHLSPGVDNEGEKVEPDCQKVGARGEDTDLKAEYVASVVPTTSRRSHTSMLRYLYGRNEVVTRIQEGILTIHLWLIVVTIPQRILLGAYAFCNTKLKSECWCFAASDSQPYYGDSQLGNQDILVFGNRNRIFQDAQWQPVTQGYVNIDVDE